jgi:hypothetical protein
VLVPDRGQAQAQDLRAQAEDAEQPLELGAGDLASATTSKGGTRV